MHALSISAWVREAVAEKLARERDNAAWEKAERLDGASR